MSARSAINEILGAVNVWLEKNGRAHMVHGGHAEFAAKTTGINFIKHGQDSNRYWKEQGTAYQKMFTNGWARVSIFGPAKRIQVDFRGSLSKKQYEWLADEAFARKSAVVDDSDYIYLDFRNEPGAHEESVAGMVVRRIMENDLDPKAFAMSDAPINYEDAWVDLAGPGVHEQVPVVLHDNGWVLADAAYSLAWAVDEDVYGRITAAILTAVNGGEASGEVEGFKWRFYSNPESPATAP